MKKTLAINERDPRIACFMDQWRRNRDMVQGERAVKPAGKRYLPCEKGIEPDQHANIVLRTPFFPGAARTHDGLIGLIFHKPATIEVPDAYRDIVETITDAGFTLDDLAEDLASEFLITNFVGLVTDYPPSAGVYTRAQAEAAGNRPFIAMYCAESILGIETGVINNRQRVVRVRLEQDCETIRELRLDDDRYTVTVWRLIDENWIPDQTITPTKAGQPLDEIPFTLVTTSRRFLPTKAKLADVCDVNAQHYIASMTLAIADYWVSNPMPYLFGLKADSLSMGPGKFLTSETKGTDVKIGMLEYTGASLTQLQDRVDSLTNDMAKVGSRILAQEKAAVEAADSLAIKTASENAALASTARLVSRWINDQLKWVAWWLGIEEGSISFDLNTSYDAAKLTFQDRAQIVAEWSAGLYSKDAALDQLIEGDILPETFDRELDAQKMAEEMIDRPPVDPPASNQGAQPSA